MIADVLWACLQVLHYSVDRMQEKLQYLRDIGMGQEQVAQSLVRLPQLLSLDISHNMKPKYNYLQSQLGGSVQTVCAYPAYFSLSLLQRYPCLFACLQPTAFSSNLSHRLCCTHHTTAMNRPAFLGSGTVSV